MKRTLLFVLALSYACGFAQDSKELTKLKQQSNAQVTISQSTSNPNFIRFENAAGLQLKSAQAKDKVSEFLASNFTIFNLKAANELVFADENTDNYGLKNVIYRQVYQGIPVYDGVLKFHFNEKGQLSSLNGNTISNIKVSTTPSISAAAAGSIAKNLVKAQNNTTSDAPLEVAKSNLLIFPKNLVQGGQVESYLAYEIEVTNKSEDVSVTLNKTAAELQAARPAQAPAPAPAPAMRARVYGCGVRCADPRDVAADWHTVLWPRRVEASIVCKSA